MPNPQRGVEARKTKFARDGVKLRGHVPTETLDELAEKTALLRTALGGKHEGILAAMAELRKVVDALEREVDDARWPLPKYREMLFVY